MIGLCYNHFAGRLRLCDSGAAGQAPFHREKSRPVGRYRTLRWDDAVR